MLLIARGLLVLFFYITSLVFEYNFKLNLFNLFLLLLFIIFIIINNAGFNFISGIREFNFLRIYCGLNSVLLVLFLIIYMLIMLLLNLEMLSRFKNSFRIIY